MVVPPPIALAAAVGAVLALPSVMGGYRVSGPHVAGGLAVIAASALVIVAAGRAFRSAGTPVRPLSPTLRVVRSGPYRFSRNPMYVAMIGVVIGAGMLTANHLFVAVAVVLALVLHFGAVLPEERYLRQLFPDQAPRYFATVRRWI